MTSLANTSSCSFPEISGYTLVEQLYFGSRTAVYRAIKAATQAPVVIKVLRREYPSFSELMQFRNQYAIAKNLPIAGIVQPLSLEPVGSSYALVMEDWGGVALGQYLHSQSLDWSEVLAIALQLADILHELIQHRVVHKDIKPANILIHPESKQVKLIDFSIASALPKETQDIQSPNGLEGTLAYLAPEQTGRMNRGIDYRADFYALGVTLYQLLTGTLPFTAEDPLELVHCHIAKLPVPVDQVNPAVPAMVAAIVTKLMAKNAEDRYQSALGLKQDLQQCLTQWKETGAIAPFALGERDMSDRFLIPETLYGREVEVQTLLQSFARVAEGASELMLVGGFSGIGKTAVVHEVHKPIVRQRGYFIKGKFDQFNRNIPLSAFVQALRDLMGQLLSESDAQIDGWKTRILTAVGEQGQVLMEVIPELEQIIGQQPAAPELSGSAAQSRFNRLFQQFIQVFTTAEHPLVVFLDDLQWADLASLQLLKLLMEDSSYLLVIGAYRDNEVSPTHPFITTVEDLKKAQKTVQTITLKPLSFQDTNALIADTLHCPFDLVTPLTQLIDRKTQGNPFFTTQFLKALHAEGHICFDQDCRYWSCDIAQVNALTLTDDVVEFMAAQLQKLPPATQAVLKLAACVGNQFDLATLAIASEQSTADVAAALWQALQEGLVLPTSQVYKFFQRADLAEAEESANPTYRFLHDRVQQAAYQLIPESQKPSLHLTIGRLLLRQLAPSEREEQLFEIVAHLNVGQSMLSTAPERQELARLNLAAGHKAKAATAYEAAVRYLATGIALLPDDAWEQHYDLALALYTAGVGAACLKGDFEQTEQWAACVLQHARTLLDTMAVQQTRLLGLRSQGRFVEAIQLGLAVLQSLGVSLPSQPTQSEVHQAFSLTQQLWQGRSPLALLELPVMTDERLLAAMELLSWLVPGAYITNPALMGLLICEQIKLSIQHGNCLTSCYSYADYGVVLCGVAGDLSAGYGFGQLALKLLEQQHATTAKPRVWCIVHNFIQHWHVSLHDSVPCLKEAFQVGLQMGDLEVASLNAVAYCYYAYHAGDELIGLAQEMEAYYQTIHQSKQVNSAYFLASYYQTVLNLLGQSGQPDQLMGPILDEREMVPLWQSQNNRTALFYLFCNQASLSYLFGNYQVAAQKSALAEQYLDAGMGTFMVPLHHFYDALIQLALYKTAGEAERVEMLERVTAHQEKLQHWASFVPVNHQHRWELVAAEQARVLHQKAEASEHYDRAIALANESGYLQDAALANELAARFYLEWHKDRIAQEYLIDAYYGYACWGAKAKVADLERRYPQLLSSIFQQGQTPLSTHETVFSAGTHPTTSSSSASTVSHSLDLAAILKASQTLSSAIELDTLLETLLDIVLQNAGADKAALLMPQDQEWFVEAIASLGQPAQIDSIPLAESGNLPHCLAHQTKHSQSPVVIVDATVHPTLATDAYVMQHQPKSLLCTPIVNQGQLVAMLYLENRVTAGVFTRDRIDLLNFLCSQAAISLKNARLYQQTQESQQLLQLVFDTLPQRVFWKDRESRFLGCNKLFLQDAGLTNLTQIIGKTDFELCWQAHAEEYRAKDLAVLNSETPKINFEEPLTKEDGTKMWLRTSKIPLRNSQGEVIGVFGSYEDITPLKQAEEVLKQQKQDLELALRQLQETQLQMVQNEKMASLGNLVAGVAHEINNPVGFLNGSINNAKEYVQDLLGHLALYEQHYPEAVAPVRNHAEDIDLEFLSEDLPKLLDSMKGATDRIKSISTSLRTFSRADTEYKVQANINDGIDSTILILKYRLKANATRPEIEVIKDYEDLPLIECFPGQLNQVFMNILANAIDMFDELASQSSFAELQKKTQQVTIQTLLSGANVEIRIRDNGKGMSEAVKARVFDHLFTTKGVGKGTGLGLAIARQIVVEKHGGSLEVQSELGQGTEFCIRLPIAG